MKIALIQTVPMDQVRSQTGIGIACVQAYIFKKEDDVDIDLFLNDERFNDDFNPGMLLAEVVACSAAVGATRARTAKAAALAALLRAAAPGEIEPATAWLTGEPRQGRLGAGWRTLAALGVPPAATPGLEVADVEARLDALATTSGTGSTARRAAQLDALFGVAREHDEQRRQQEGEAEAARGTKCGHERSPSGQTGHG